MASKRKRIFIDTKLQALAGVNKKIKLKTHRMQTCHERKTVILREHCLPSPIKPGGNKTDDLYFTVEWSNGSKRRSPFCSRVYFLYCQNKNKNK